MAKVAVRLASAFAPTDIPNLVLHLDAASGVYTDAGTTEATDGQTVQEWHDLSGASNHAAQTVAARKPVYQATGLNGGPGVDFGYVSGYPVLLTPEFLDATFDTSATLFWIGENSSVSDACAAAANSTRFAGADVREWVRFDTAQLAGTELTDIGAQTHTGNIRCAGLSYDGTTLRMLVNGYYVAWPAAGDLGLSSYLTVGNRAAVSGSLWDGPLGAVYLWRYGATESQMRRMSTYLLARWGLSTPASPQLVCYVGDSQTATAYYKRWPSYVAEALGTTAQAHTVRAASGATLSYINSIAASYIDPLLDASRTCVNVVWCGMNDLAGGTSGADTYARLVTYCNARRAAGWDKLVVTTMLPRSEDGITAGHEARRQAFNTLLRANYTDIADALIDLAADNRIGDDGDELDTTYYKVDRVHLNDDGGQPLVGDLAAPVIAAQL